MALSIICARCFTMRPAESMGPVLTEKGLEWFCDADSECSERLAALPDTERSFAEWWDAMEASGAVEAAGEGEWLKVYEELTPEKINAPAAPEAAPPAPGPVPAPEPDGPRPPLSPWAERILTSMRADRAALGERVDSIVTSWYETLWKLPETPVNPTKLS